MSDVTIYHNPRCRKSREGFHLLQEMVPEFKTVLYMKEPLTYSELKHLLTLLKISPMALVRTNESIWKEKYSSKELSDDDIITAMVTHHNLIERPIVGNGDRAVIAHPAEKLHQLF